MHKLTLFPLGNADCCLVDLANGQKLLFDYADMRDRNAANDRRIDLPAALRNDLGERDAYNVVAFTHADNDHVCGASQFFHFQHAKQYQGGDRVKIDDLWVPAAIITEAGLVGDARVIQAEARHRLRKGSGIRVFSRPARLRDWLAVEGINLDERAHLITDAGQLVPGFTKTDQGVEFFVHSPFGQRLDADTVVDRNDCSLVLQATFDVEGVETRLILAADTTWDNFVPMIRITRHHKRDERLAWDVFKLPHHCSYLSLSSEKGKNITTPEPDISWLFEQQGAERGIIVSTSDPIPATDTDQPPHRQAANYYKGVVADMDGEFKVTMEHPSVVRPEPLIITIDRGGATLRKRGLGISTAITSRPAPRVGS